MSKSQANDRKANLPTYSVFIKVEQEGGKPRLENVGAAWPTQKGTGFNLVLDRSVEEKRLLVLPFKRQYHG